METVVKRVEEKFSYPVFIKPSNAGSSRGVSKASCREELEKGLTEAARHDRKILVEEMIVGHEIECAVFGGGNGEVIASGVGEILAAADSMILKQNIIMKNPEQWLIHLCQAGLPRKSGRRQSGFSGQWTAMGFPE